MNGRKIGHLHQVVDNALKPQSGAVLRGVDLADPVGFEVTDLFRYDDTAAAAENLYIGSPVFSEKVDHILEKLHMPALVAGNGNGLCILLDGGIHDLLNGAVVSEMYHLHPGILHDAAHDVDGGIVAVEKRGGGDDSDMMSGLIGFYFTGHNISFFPVPKIG